MVAHGCESDQHRRRVHASKRLLEVEERAKRPLPLSGAALDDLGEDHGGICGEAVTLGEPVAHVALLFSADVDPDEVLVAAGVRTRAQARPLTAPIVEAGKGYLVVWVGESTSWDAQRGRRKGRLFLD